MVTGCARDPFVTTYDLKVSQEVTPPERVVSANIGIYYEDSSANYVHLTSREKGISARDIGRRGVSLFNSVIPGVFRKAELVGELPPYDIPH